MCHRILATALLILGVASAAAPDCFPVERITVKDSDDTEVNINASGEIVWSGHIQDLGNRYIYHYYEIDGQPTIQTVCVGSPSGQPQINDPGTIVWNCTADAANGIWRDGPYTREQLSFPDSPDYDHEPQVNSLHEVVWYGNRDSQLDLFYADAAGDVTRLTNDAEQDYFPVFNDAGQIAWTHYIGDEPYTFFRDSDGTIADLSQGGQQHVSVHQQLRTGRLV